MPNMLDDGLLEQALIIRTFANNPTNKDFQLQNAVSTAVCNAAQNGLGTVSVSVAAYDNTLIQFLIQRLINMGYLTATLVGTTLTVTW